RLIPDHALGLPVLRTLSLCTCCRHYPGAATGRRLRSSSPSRISLPRKGRRVGLHIVLFGACSAFTRVAACTLARSPVRDPHSEGFSHFVTSMTAPVASGWSDLPVGICTHWKAPPYHGARQEQTFGLWTLLVAMGNFLKFSGARSTHRRPRGAAVSASTKPKQASAAHSRRRPQIVWLAGGGRTGGKAAT